MPRRAGRADPTRIGNGYRRGVDREGDGVWGDEEELDALTDPDAAHEESREDHCDRPIETSPSV